MSDKQVFDLNNNFQQFKSVCVFHNIIYDKINHKWIFNHTTQPKPISFDRIANDEDYAFKTERNTVINAKNAKVINEPCVLHRYNYPSCLWHMFMDGLVPTFFLGENFADGRYKILRTINGETKKFQSSNFIKPFDNWQSWINLLGKETEILEDIDAEIILFRKLIVGYLPLHKIMNHNKINLINFRDQILKSLNLTMPKNPNKILFLNRNVEKRRIINYKDIIGHLENKGIDFEYAEFEGMSFIEQVKKIIQCRILIGPEGAGLYHSLFMKTGSKLIAIYPKNYIRKDDCWRNLSKWAGNLFEYISAEDYDHEKHCCNRRFAEELEELNNSNSDIHNYSKIKFDNPLVKNVFFSDDRSNWLIKHLVKNQNMSADPYKISEAILKI